MSDKYYLDFIRNTKSLKDTTKDLYIDKIKILQTLFLKKRTIHWILYHPEESIEVFKEGFKEMSSKYNEQIGDHTKELYISSLMALFTYNSEFKNDNIELFEKWKNIHSIIHSPIDYKYKSNEPTERQKEGYVGFEEFETMRDSLPSGSIERLLLSIYTYIPPVRNDYWRTKIYYDDKVLHSKKIEENCIILNNFPKLILKKYKTAKTYGTIFIDIPSELKDEIMKSIEKLPRDYLFVSSVGDHLPYTNATTFDSWVNKKLKKIFNKPRLTLTMFRHSYISRRDLKLEEKSGLEQDEIAKIMGHSINQQRKYLWHTWLKKKEINI